MKNPFQDIYDKIPKIECKGLCGKGHNMCCGPIGCVSGEARLLEQYNGTSIQWLSLENNSVMMDMEALAPSLQCPLLGLDGRCQAYDVRPLVCRLWGVVKEMQCHHGCQPERWLPDSEARLLMREVAKRNVLHLQSVKPCETKAL